LTGATGIFAGRTHIGDILGGAGVLNTAQNLPIFTLPGLSFITLGGVNLSGGMAGLTVVGGMNIVGNLLPFASALWIFTAPPLDFSHDEQGPIQLEFRAFNNRFATPDGGTTVALMGLGLLALGAVRRFV